MKIKPISIEYYESIIVLWEKAKLPYKPKGRDSKEELKKQMQRDPDLFLGAFENNELIGSVFATDDGRKGWINRLAVHPDHSGKGIGKILCQKAESQLQKRGRKIICTLVEDWNQDSLKFFNNIGYKKHDDIFYLSKRENENI
jgi:ribosomal protein S18 acetylase RimI-like enzyme